LNTVIDRFLSKISISDSCWEWTDCKDKDGYGRIRINRKEVRAHRFAYEYYYGDLDPILQIDHLCRNPRCVNPIHLEQVTCKENINRGLTGIKNKVKTHCSRGHEYNEKNTRVTSKNQRICRICMRDWQRE